MHSTDSYQIFNETADSSILLLCDHATNIVPKTISNDYLGLSLKELQRHIAYDIGALKTAKKISKLLKAPLISTRFSRLIIDPNRSKSDPTLIMQIYDGSIIPGNLNLSKDQINFRIRNYYDPYHRTISKFLLEKKSKDKPIFIVSIHSFNPQLRGKKLRPWHIGILWDQDTRLSNVLIKNLKKYENVCIGKNQPYSGSLIGDTMHRHGTINKIPHGLIEIRNDLIESSEGQKKWSDILALIINESIIQLSN